MILYHDHGYVLRRGEHALLGSTMEHAGFDARVTPDGQAAILAAARRLIRAVKILARDCRIPKPLRALAAFGVLPIPGPFDEAVLVIVGILIWLFYRDRLREAWTRAGTSPAPERERGVAST